MKSDTTKIAWVPVVVLVIGVSVGSFYLGSRHGASKVEEGVVKQRSTLGANSTVIEPPAIAAEAKGDPVLGEERMASPVTEVQGASEPHVVEAVATAPTRENIESEQKQRLMRNLENNLAMPGMSQIIQEQQRVLMADQFRDLIATYGLNDEEQDYFLELLTARRMYEVDMGMKLMTGMLSEGERDELLAQVGAGIEEMNKEIDWFLNSEADSEYFDYYQQTEGERSVVNSISDRLSQAGNPLNEGVDRELIAIMHEEISSYPFSVQFEENGGPGFYNYTDANINTYVQEMGRLREPVMEEASQVLAPEQLDVFADSFDQYIAFVEQRLRLVQQLFNPSQ